MVRNRKIMGLFLPAITLLLSAMVFSACSKGTASISIRYGVVYVAAADREAETVDLYNGDVLYEDVKIANYDTDYTYAGVMEAKEFLTESIQLFDVVPMVQTIGIVDEDTISVSGAPKPLSADATCYATVDGIVGVQLQAADNKGSCPYTSAAAIYDDAGSVAALYYTYTPATLPRKDTPDVAWLGNADEYGTLGLNDYGIVTLETVFGVYDKDGKKLDYIPGSKEMMAGAEVVFEIIPALVPFNNAEILADGSRNTFPDEGLVFTDTLAVKAEGSNNSAILAINGGMVKAGVVNILSSASLDSKIIDGELNTHTEADEFNNKEDLGGQPNNTDYFNVKTNELGSNWGTDAVVYALNGGKIFLGDNDGERSTVTASGAGGNLLWATSVGAEIHMENADLIGYNAANHITDVTYGGRVVVDNVYMESFQGTSTALTTDFGSGTVNATNVTAVTHTGGSAGAYVEGGGWVTADNSAMGGVFKTADEALTAMGRWQAAVDQAGGEKPAFEIDGALKTANMIWAMADAGAVASHHGWIDYTGVNAAGPYGVLAMNTAAPLQARVNIKDSSLVGWGEGTKTSTNFGAGRPVSALVGVFGGGGIINIEDSLLVVNRQKQAKMVSRRDPWSRGNSEGPEAGTIVDQYNYLVYGMTNSFMIYNFTGEGTVNFIDCDDEKTLIGDIFVEGGAKDKIATTNILHINLVNSDLKGNIQYQKEDDTCHAGMIDLSLDENATWKVTGDSYLTHLTVADAGSITAETPVTVTFDEADGISEGKAGNVTFVKR